MDTWRTPDAPNAGGPRNRNRSIGGGHQVTIAEQAEQWQTPATDSFRGRGGARADEPGPGRQGREWPSPDANMDSYRLQGQSQQSRSLEPTARAFPSMESPRATPSARDWKDSAGMSATATNPDGTARTRDDQLARQVFHCSLPAPATTTDGAVSSPSDLTSRPPLLWASPQHNADSGSRNVPGSKAHAGTSLADQVTTGSSQSGRTGNTKRLNPVFVEWLMGWPIGWTGSGPVEMASFQSRLRSHLLSLVGDLG